MANFFGENARIYGADINPYCKHFESENTKIFIGDQGDSVFLQHLKNEIPRIDILIDDGGHLASQQIAIFQNLSPHISANGVYLCEDLHTSYWSDWGGGLGKPGTFIEFSKRLIDQINAWHSREHRKLAADEFTLTSHGMSFYDSVLVIEKRRIAETYHRKTGMPTLPDPLG